MNVKKLFTNKDLKNINNKKVITLKDANIPTSDIENNDDIVFIVCTSDEKVLQQTLDAIVKVKNDYQNKNFTVFISSSYEKLHKLINGSL